jgi:hypothetical protein
LQCHRPDLTTSDVAAAGREYAMTMNLKLSSEDLELVSLLLSTDDVTPWLQLDVHEVIRRCEFMLSAWGGTLDETLVEKIMLLYSGYAKRTTVAQRRAWYEGIVHHIRHDGWDTVALMPWIYEEPTLELASTVALDFSVLSLPEGGDRLSGPRMVARIVSERNVSCPPGPFAGLLHVGDDRVCALIEPIRGTLTEAEVGAVCRCHSDFVLAATVEFYLD